MNNEIAPGVRVAKLRARLRAGDTLQTLAAHPLVKRPAEELLARLDLVKLAPETIVCLDVDVGEMSHRLAHRYPRSRVIACSAFGPHPRRLPARWWPGSRRRQWPALVASPEALPIADQSADVLCANLVFACFSLEAVLTEVRRVLRPGGLLVFSAPGPQTLIEVRDAWQCVGAADNRVHGFADIASVGDLLTHFGFQGAVMDIDRECFAVDSARDLIQLLRALGLQNVRDDGPRGLTGPRQWRQFCASLERQIRAGDRAPGASVEVVFGHAWAPSRDGLAVNLD